MFGLCSGFDTILGMISLNSALKRNSTQYNNSVSVPAYHVIKFYWRVLSAWTKPAFWPGHVELCHIKIFSSVKNKHILLCVTWYVVTSTYTALSYLPIFFLHIIQYLMYNSKLDLNNLGFQNSTALGALKRLYIENSVLGNFACICKQYNSWNLVTIFCIWLWSWSCKAGSFRNPAAGGTFPPFSSWISCTIQFSILNYKLHSFESVLYPS